MLMSVGTLKATRPAGRHLGWWTAWHGLVGAAITLAASHLQLAAPLWHSFMSVAHRDMNIATLPGLEPHPVQLAEMQRIAELKRTNPAAAAAELGAAASKPGMKTLKANAKRLGKRSPRK